MGSQKYQIYLQTGLQTHCFQEEKTVKRLCDSESNIVILITEITFLAPSCKKCLFAYILKIEKQKCLFFFFFNI